MQNERHRSRLAVLCVVAASVCFSTGGLFMKLILLLICLLASIMLKLIHCSDVRAMVKICLLT